MKLEFSRQFLEKYSTFKFHENPSSCSMRTGGRTDRHDEANSDFSQFYERALKEEKRKNKKGKINNKNKRWGT